MFIDLAPVELSKTAMMQTRLGGGFGCIAIIAGWYNLYHPHDIDL
jgi:hypothetical protein